MPSKISSKSQRSPSPRSKAPIASAPDQRAQRLQEVFDSALKHTLKPCSYDNFAACFPTPAAYEPDALKEFHRNFVGRLDAMCRSEYAALLEERNVISSLNQLDSLIAEATKLKANASEEGRKSPPVPPHLLPPAQVLEAHLALFATQQSANIQEQLDDTQKSNIAMAEEVMAQRNEIEQLVRTLELAVGDLEGAVKPLTGEGMADVDHDLDHFAASGMVK